MNSKEGRTFGNAWMYTALIGILKHVNIRVLYVFMSVCIIPITLLVSPGAKLTYSYYRKKKRMNCFVSLLWTYKNHVVFGQTVIDKFAMYAGHHFIVNYHGIDYFQHLSQQPSAFIQLSAHIGCSEIVGYSYDSIKPSNVLVYGGEHNDFMKYRESAFGNKNIKMIPVGAGEDHSEEIIEALDRNEIVHAFVDRFMNTKKTIISKLHGHTVRLAKGPFSIAVTRGLDVIMTCAMKETDGSYTTYMTPLFYDKNKEKRVQCQQLADAYTSEIEKLLLMYPDQWFNYSDIWVD